VFIVSALPACAREQVRRYRDLAIEFVDTQLPARGELFRAYRCTQFKPGVRVTVEGIVHTALGAVLLACLAMAAVLSPCAWIYKVSGTNLVVPVAEALVLGLLVVAILSVVAILLRCWIIFGRMLSLPWS
jgi:hypothetical protein